MASIFKRGKNKGKKGTKWNFEYVDENGKVYFSDKPPQDAKKQEVVDIKANTQPSSSPGGLPKVAKLDPIGNSDDRESKTILLEHMKMALENGEQIKCQCI